MTEVLLHPLTRIGAEFSDPDIAYWDGQNRERVDETHEDWLIDNLIPIGASVIYADPGQGKSFILLSVIHHLVYGTPLGPWGSEGPGRALCLVYDLEGTWKLTQDRGYAITPYGDAEWDGRENRQDNYCFWQGQIIPPAEREAWKIIPNQAKRHIQYLDQTLTEAEQAGAPVRLVVIDTLSKFCGPKPNKAAGNAYEYEAEIVDGLNRVALRHKCAVVLIHHTNKAGEISGSMGIGGSAIVTAILDVDEQDDDELAAGDPKKAVLRSTKVRIGAPFCYSLVQRPDGPWDFVDRPPSEAVARGQALTVLQQLNDRPGTYTELLSRTGLGASLSQVLYRMRKRRDIYSRHGKWHIRLPEVAVRSLPGSATGICTVCGGPMTLIPGEDRHPGCEPPSSAVEKQEDPPRDQGEPLQSGGNIYDPSDDEAFDDSHDDDVSRETERTDAIGLLQASIQRSRMHPVQFIKREHREREPWSLITERMTGEHAWLNPEAVDVDPAAMVAVLDRNGSYPSAMSSVTVAPNLLHHTGDLDSRLSPGGQKLAGIFLVEMPEWDSGKYGIGHPLGRLSHGAIGDLVWMPTPHLETLEKLYGMGLLERPIIHDSWSGRSTGGLFTQFSAKVRDLRAELGDGQHPAEYTELKTMTSIAIRSLWPKRSRSPFFRPDWSVSVRAEASARHWWRAFQCSYDVEIGRRMERVLRLGRVDEVVVMMGARLPAPHVPDPYRLGSKFGEVKHKTVKLPDGRDATSPMLAGIWKSSVRSLRGEK